MYQDLLPLSLQGDWRDAPVVPLSPHLSQWLFEPGSLTQKLKSHCNAFRVQILAKSERMLGGEELGLFTSQRQKVQVREVVLYCDDEPWVYAQSLMPLGETCAAKKLTALGEKPLGEVIFSEPGMTRSAIEVCRFADGSDVTLLAQQMGLSVNHSLWGRRSCFKLDDYELLVCEVFLPGARAYL